MLKARLFTLYISICFLFWCCVQLLPVIGDWASKRRNYKVCASKCRTWHPGKRYALTMRSKVTAHAWPCVCVCVCVFVCEYVSMWVCEYLSIWVCEYVSMWVCDVCDVCIQAARRKTHTTVLPPPGTVHICIALCAYIMCIFMCDVADFESQTIFEHLFTHSHMAPVGVLTKSECVWLFLAVIRIFDLHFFLFSDSLEQDSRPSRSHLCKFTFMLVKLHYCFNPLSNRAPTPPTRLAMEPSVATTGSRSGRATNGRASHGRSQAFARKSGLKTGLTILVHFLETESEIYTYL